MASNFTACEGGRRSIAHATVLAGLLALGPVMASAQTIQLSSVALGSGGFVINGQSTADRSGRSVSSAGDVNGDGLADMIVGAPYSDVGAAFDSGRSYVVFGKNNGGVVNLTAVDNGVGGFVINGQGAGDRSGTAVSSAGDVNGDGLADVIVGAPQSDPIGGAGAGRSYVVFGKTAGVDVDLSAVDNGTGGFVINGQSPNENSGQSVSAAGDVNGDGLGDLIVGAPLSDPPTRVNAGRSYVVFGKTDGADVELLGVEGGSGGFVINGQAADDESGGSVASAGDVNGDGLADVIVGAAKSDPAAGSRAGRSYVVFGKTNGTAVELSAIDNGIGGYVLNGQAANDYSGTSVSSAGDANSDGLADVIVGAPRSDPAAGLQAGRSYVVFGKTSGTDVELSNIDNGTGGYVINGQAAGDYSGFSVSSAGDVDGDGGLDVIVGAYRSDPAAGTDAGRSYVVFGKQVLADSDLSAVAAGTGGFVIDGDAAGSDSGRSVCAAGDVDGDGFSDLVVGAPYADPVAGSNAGRSYVVFSPPTLVFPAVSYRSRVGSGDIDRTAIGAHRFGDDSTAYPDSRFWVDFNAGAASLVIASLFRNDNTLGNISSTQVANVYWQANSNRTGVTTTRATVRYTDEEIAGLNEASLTLLSAPTTAGPFAAPSNIVHNPARNEFSGTVNSLPRVFIIADVGAPTGEIVRLDQNPTSADVVDFLVGFSEPVGTSFSAADIALNGSLGATSTIREIIASDPDYVVRVIAKPLASDGTLGITVATSVTDLAGNAVAAPIVSPLYTVERGAASLAGDVNKDGVVNVADVTLLGNFIVNGAPPLP